MGIKKSAASGPCMPPSGLYMPRPTHWCILLRGAILNRTYVKHKNLYISLFLLTIVGPIYYGPP